jgi:hypothetical protein
MANLEAQNIVICELCDNSNPVRWNCINCLEDLCDSCRIVHTRGKVTKHVNFVLFVIIAKQKIKQREYMLNSYTYITVYYQFVLTDDQCIYTKLQNDNVNGLKSI